MKTSLQISAIKKVEDLQCVSRITARIKYHKKEANRQNNV